jgi:hypothetical protein
VCAAAALVGFLGFVVGGQPRAGILLAIGLGLGGVNALLAARTAEVGIAFRFLSVARIGILSVLALLVAVLVQPASAWLTMIGIGASLFLMSALAAREVLRR